jgi:hypothetical protein
VICTAHGIRFTTATGQPIQIEQDGDHAALYSARLQELLVYSVRDPGFMWYVDGMHPKHLFAPDYQDRKAHGVQACVFWLEKKNEH